MSEVPEGLKALCSEFAVFVGSPLMEVISRVLKGPELAREEWLKRNPKTSCEILDFYMTSEMYIYELIGWAYRSRADLDQIVSLCGGLGGRILDFGGGIGELCIKLAEKGLDVTYLDVESLASKFAKWRFKNRKLSIPVIETRWEYPSILGRYNVIVCFHVLEHLKEPQRFVKLFYDTLEPHGSLIAAMGVVSTDTLLHLPENLSLYVNFKDEMQKLRFENPQGLLFRKMKE